jgi:hypothetical protein
LPHESQAQLRQLARRGAELRLRELLEEASSLVKMFPPLKDAFDAEELPVRFLLRRGANQGALKAEEAATASSKHKPGRRRWTAAQRKAHAAKMKAYWAKRQKS